MNVILIDDETGNSENLQSLLAKHFSGINVLCACSQVDEAVSKIEQLEPDLIFLDIQMGKQSGFDLLGKVTIRNFEVIFVTAYDKYGIQAIKFAALDYLLKPIDINELKEAVAKAEKKITERKTNTQLDFLIQNLKQTERRQPKIALPQLQEIRYVQVNDIVRCEAENSYTFFHLSNGDKILVSKPLKEYAEMLQPYGFIRTHQSHLANPAFVKSWLREDGGSLLLNNGIKIPVSKMNKDSVKQALTSNA
ncbi:DNA-binding response regulator [Arachidicoccus ginsenosidimutans]|uniref:LytR/AlgR family response regulator transcription factor n=1 Tax=Arachidicoccus sp. BS20 TaxID=1850526 RepID=UPI0007F10F26|nr:LytTR family DNA-binding domain-containing protein [Arachidicoccus sp. BS20]ANI88801.1 DNA-binding response regulator [Arachidicoccus sp. BS20]